MITVPEPTDGNRYVLWLMSTTMDMGTWSAAATTMGDTDIALAQNQQHPESNTTICEVIVPINGGTGALITPADDTTFTFAPTVTPATQVADLLADKTFVVTLPSSETNPTDAQILAAIKAAVQAEMDADAAARITAVDNTTTTTLTGAAAGATVRCQTVTVTVDSVAGKPVNSVQFTHLYNETGLKAAVTAALGNPSATTVDTDAKLVTAIENYIKSVNGVSNVSVTDVIRTGGAAADLANGAIYGFNWSLTYNGETVTGSDQVTMTT